MMRANALPSTKLNLVFKGGISALRLFYVKSIEKQNKKNRYAEVPSR